MNQELKVARGTTDDMVVDSVADVIALGSERIRPAPDLPLSNDVEYITRLSAADKRMLIFGRY